MTQVADECTAKINASLHKFKVFLKDNVPKKGHKLIEQFANATTEQFITYISIHVIKYENSLDDYVAMLLNQFKLTFSDFTPEQIEMFKLYMKFFIKVVHRISSPITAHT